MNSNPVTNRFLSLAALVGMAFPQLDMGNCCCARQQDGAKKNCCQVRDTKPAEVEKNCCCSKKAKAVPAKPTCCFATQGMSGCRQCSCKTGRSEKTTAPARRIESKVTTYNLHVVLPQPKAQRTPNKSHESTPVLKPPARLLYCVWLN